MIPTAHPLLLLLLLLPLVAAAGCAAKPSPQDGPHAPTATTPDASTPTAPPPTVELSLTPGEECGDGQHTLASATISIGTDSRVLPDPGFETEVCCAAFQTIDSPPGTTVQVAGCEPWSCGGGCLRTTQVLYVPHEAPERAQWFELSCNENLSASAEGEVNDACDEIVQSAGALSLVFESTDAKACPEEQGGDEGRIESATVRRDRVVLTRAGAERTPGETEEYMPEVWGCGPE